MPALLETLAYFNSSLLFTLGSGGRDGRAIHMHMDVQEDDLKRLSTASRINSLKDAARSETHNHSCSDADDHNHYLPFRNPTIFTRTSALALNASAAAHGLIKECEAFNTTHDKALGILLWMHRIPHVPYFADCDVRTNMRRVRRALAVANHTIVVHKVRSAGDFEQVHEGVSRRWPAARPAHIECLLDCSTSPRVSRACSKQNNTRHAARRMYTDGFALSQHYRRYGGLLIDPQTSEWHTYGKTEVLECQVDHGRWFKPNGVLGQRQWTSVHMGKSALVSGVKWAAA